MIQTILQKIVGPLAIELFLWLLKKYIPARYVNDPVFALKMDSLVSKIKAVQDEKSALEASRSLAAMVGRPNS